MTAVTPFRDVHSRLSEFFENGFFEALGGGRSIPRTRLPAEEIADLWGATPAAELARLADFLGTQRGEPKLFEFYAFDADDWLPGARNAFDFMLHEWFRRVALLTGTLPIGCTGSGDIWLVEATPRPSGHHVFLLDHELSELSAVADSLESFAWLCYLGDAGRTRGVGPEEWTIVAGKVRGWVELTIPIADTLPEDARLRARHAANGDLLAALWHGAEFEVGPTTATDDDAITLLGNLLRCFLRDEDGPLATLLERARLHPARMLRDAAQSLSEKREIRGFEPRLLALNAG